MPKENPYSKIDWSRIDWSYNNLTLSELLGVTHETVCRKRSEHGHKVFKRIGRFPTGKSVPHEHRTFGELSRIITHQLGSRDKPSHRDTAVLLELLRRIHNEAEEREREEEQQKTRAPSTQE